jgi:hypothetical protein
VHLRSVDKDLKMMCDVTPGLSTTYYDDIPVAKVGVEPEFILVRADRQVPKLFTELALRLTITLTHTSLRPFTGNKHSMGYC